MPNLHAIRITLTGRVQGVGFRPFVNRLAQQMGISGWVRNRSGVVEIHAEADEQTLNRFQNALIEQAPPLAKPEYTNVIGAAPEQFSQFGIEASAVSTEADNHIPPDYFVCDECLQEMQDPQQRRYRYPFINCTQCGPRYTLIDALPYDRPNTTMAAFKFCPACEAEYGNPLDRRYHAQPLACADCGPVLTFFRPGTSEQKGNEIALAACIASLQAGQVVAVKGVGGYHLMCDAGNADSVNHLRVRKNRPDKPLAVMVPWQGDGLAMVRQLAILEPCEATRLVSPERPIVLLQKHDFSSLLADEIAPSLNEVGLMLPYSPLHYLLLNDFGKPLVATSANLSGEPVLTDAQEVEARLANVADAFLHHDRPIRRPADDSVFRRIAGYTRPIRLGRGHAPLEFKLPIRFPGPLLAVGADLKNTVALGFGDRVVMSPHIGDLGSNRSQQVFEQVVADFQALYEVKPSAIVCDAHPHYHSQRWAHANQIPIIPVFHHHAHASALAGEHQISEAMLVFTWDGTGYGEDGTIWGGETLFGRSGHWQRVGSLRPFYLPGGDKASRQPWRSALSLCWELQQEWPNAPQDTALLKAAWERRLNCPQTSSAGRLFDAAAALIGVTQSASYEGHAAMQLEAISQEHADGIDLPIVQTDTELLLTDWGPLIPVLLNKSLTLCERGSLFHTSLANAIVAQAVAHQQKYAFTRVGLSGGVFQNRLLTEQAFCRLQEQGFEVYLHEKLPAGDGGISFGQLITAGCQMHIPSTQRSG